MSKEFKLCTCSNNCCPTVNFGYDNTVSISDDYNGSVKLSFDEMNMLVQEFLKLSPVDNCGCGCNCKCGQ